MNHVSKGQWNSVWWLVSPQHHCDSVHGNIGDLHLLHPQCPVCQTQELPVPGRLGVNMSSTKWLFIRLQQNNAKSLLSAGTLMSGLSLLFFMSLLNVFFGSVMLFKVWTPSHRVPRHWYTLHLCVLTWRVLWQAHMYLGLLIMCGFVLFDTQLIIEKAENGDKDYVWWVPTGPLFAKNHLFSVLNWTRNSCGLVKIC